MSIQDKRDDMLAWWSEVNPGHWLYVENPGNVVLAEVMACDGCFWRAQLADGTRQRFRIRRRAVEWCEVSVLQNGILA